MSLSFKALAAQSFTLYYSTTTRVICNRHAFAHKCLGSRKRLTRFNPDGINSTHPGLSENFLRNLLRSSGFHLMVWYPTISDGDPKLSKELDRAFHAVWPWVSVTIFLSISTLVSRSLVPLTALSLHWSHGLVLSPLVKFQKGAPTLLEGLLPYCKWCPRKSSTCLLFTSSLEK